MRIPTATLSHLAHVLGLETSAELATSKANETTSRTMQEYTANGIFRLCNCLLEEESRNLANLSSFCLLAQWQPPVSPWTGSSCLLSTSATFCEQPSRLGDEKGARYDQASNKYTASELFVRNELCASQRPAPTLLLMYLTELASPSQDRIHPASHRGESCGLWSWGK